MLKLGRYLKPFVAGILLAIVLLFVLAMTELNLPKYMSDIVNVGIQQNGIENAAPEALSEDGLNLIKTFISEDDLNIVDKNYHVVSEFDISQSGKSYKELYPKMPEKIFIKSKTDEETSDKLEEIFGNAAQTMITALRDVLEQHSSVIEDFGEEGFETQDISVLYSMQPVFDYMPKSEIERYRETVSKEDLGLSKQFGIALSSAFYREIGADIPAMQTDYIVRAGLKMLLIALLGGIATVLVSLLSSRISSGFARNLRKDVFAKIEEFSDIEFDRFSTASLITRCTNDVTQIQQLIMHAIRIIFYAPIIGTGGVIMAINKSVSMSWIIAIAVVVLVGLMILTVSIALPKFKILQKLVDRLNLVSRENLSGMMVIRAFVTEKYEHERFSESNRELTKTSLFINKVMVLVMPIMMFIMNLVSLIIIWVGANQIAQSAMRIGDMMAFTQYAMQIIMSFLMISMIFVFLPRASVSAERISEVLETKAVIIDPEKPKNFDNKIKGIIEFKNVCFRYQGAERDALSDISFTANPGETTAIIGATGSGKSTIAKLILRFYDVSEGEVAVDGIDVRDVLQRDLRNKIGYIPQKASLLSGTVATNLRYGRPDASNEEIERSAKIAQAYDFISENEEGFDYEIAQNGSNVSGGQRQRLAIARAIAKNPEIYIFDDSFSALDFTTDLKLRKAMSESVADSTVVVIAQRISTIMNAEKIIVLDEGRIVGMGRHKELLKTCSQYAEIASSQLAGEETA
ncbi:MAG: ABC transporter ATP-binding protein [Ruminococcaceae bacterium]|nr:ABC transporter ATP-binding protein [Oscillospiraceae bacterium]